MTLLAAVLRFWWGPVIVALAAMVWLQTGRLDRVREDLARARADVAALSTAKAESERLRGVEGDRASTAYTDLQSACLDRLSVSIGAGRTIERIVNASPNPDGSRGMCDAQCVRSLVGEAEPRRDGAGLPR